MERTKPIEHIIRAAILTALCIPLSTAIGIVAPGMIGFTLLVGTLAYLFVIALLYRGGVRAGKVTLALAAFAVLAAGTTFFGIRGFSLLAILVIWSVRSVLSYSSILMSAVDLMLSIAAFSASVWVWGASNSFLLAVWTFFLLQGFSSWLPKSLKAKEEVPCLETDDRFQRAYYSAEEALKRVIRAGA